MEYENLKGRAKYLYCTEPIDLKSCVAHAVNELVSAEDLCEISSIYDISKNDLVEDIYNDLLREGL